MGMSGPRNAGSIWPSLLVLERPAAAGTANLPLLLALGGRVAEPPTDDPGGRRIRVRRRGAWAQDVDDIEVKPAEDVGNQPAVTPPPQRLGAHYRGALAQGQVDQAVQSLGEGFGGQVVC